MKACYLFGIFLMILGPIIALSPDIDDTIKQIYQASKNPSLNDIGLTLFCIGTAIFVVSIVAYVLSEERKSILDREDHG